MNPSKFSPALGAQIVANVAKGLSVARTAELAGVHRDTLYGWLKDGEKDGADASLAAFFVAYRKAEAALEEDLLAKMQRATKSEYKKYAFILERRMPKEWGSMKTLQHTGADGGPVKTEVTTRDPAGLLARVQATAARRSGGPVSGGDGDAEPGGSGSDREGG